MAGKPTPTVQSDDSLSFETAEIPEKVGVRTAEPNPFEGKVAELVADRGDEGVSRGAFSVTVPTSDVAKRVRQAQALGEGHGVSVRKQVATDGDNSVITFWVAPRIVRERKPKDEAEAES